MASRLIPITIPAPGVKGLNLQELSSLQGPEWCRVGNNLVIDETGRIATRKGWAKTHSTAITNVPDVLQVFEYKPNTGNNVDIFCADNKIWKDRTSPTDITGLLTITADNWKFQNFNGNVVGYQALHDPIIWKGTGNFTLLSAEGTPSGLVQSNEVLTAWGRTWVVDPVDNSTLRYSDLLIPQAFTGGSSGAIDLKTVWTKGQDKIIALAAFNNQLVIFGNDTTTVYANVDDITNITLAEVIYDIGCIARDSVQYVDEDIFFLSRTGVRSYKRTIIRDKLPQADITKNVRDDIIQTTVREDMDLVRSVYDKLNGFYLCTFPTSLVVYCIDIKKYVSSGEVRVFKWTDIEPLALHSLESGTIFAGFAGGYVGLLTGEDDNDSQYTSEFRSGWADVHTLTGDMALSARLVILKKYEAILKTNNNIIPALTWDYDQNDTGGNQTVVVGGSARTEYSISEYDPDGVGLTPEELVAQFGAGTTAFVFTVNTDGSGRSFSFGMRVVVNGSSTSYQYANLMFKLGRIT